MITVNASLIVFNDCVMVLKIFEVFFLSIHKRGLIC